MCERILAENSMPPQTIIADDAFDGMINKSVPVYIGDGEHQRIVGKAQVFKDDYGIGVTVQLVEDLTQPSEVLQ